MSEDDLRLFEFIPTPDPSEDEDTRNRDNTARMLTGEIPLKLENDHPQTEPPSHRQGGSECAQPFPKAVCVEHTPNYPSFVLETANGKQLFATGSVRPFEDGGEKGGHEGFLLRIVDFHNASGVGVLQLQGAVKYADLLARKKLEEQGILAGADRLLLYDVRRGNGREFSVLYQAASREKVRGAELCCCGHPGGMQYADTLGVLCGVLATEKPQRTGMFRAYALKMPGAFVLLAAEGPRFVLARRYSFMENSSKSLAGCLAAIRRDMDATGASAAVCSIRLVESAASSEQYGLLASCVSKLQGFELLPACVLQNGDGEEIFSALPGMARRFPLSRTRGPRVENVLRPLERFEKFAWMALFAGIVFCWGLVWNAQQQSGALQQHVARLGREIRQEAMLPQKIPRLEEDAFARSAQIAAMLNRVLLNPSPAALWNRLGAAKPDALSVSNLNVRYNAAGAEAALQGRMYAGPRESQQLVLEYLQRLRAGGAHIRKHELHLDGNGEQFFSLELEYPEQERAE